MLEMTMAMMPAAAQILGMLGVRQLPLVLLQQQQLAGSSSS
jgi:hypothetical protein